MITYYLSFLPFLLFFSLVPVLFLLINSIINQKKFALIIALAISPLIHSQLLYLLFMYLPHNSDLFYLLIIFLIDILLFLFSIQRFTKEIPIIKPIQIPLSLLEKFLFLANISILLLVLIRTIFYSVTWDDQNLYLKQTYVFNQSKSLDLFNSSKIFKNDVFEHQMNSGIRPGLPFIYEYSLLFSGNYHSLDTFAQSIIFYYYLLTLILICYSSIIISKTKHFTYPLFAIFLTQTSFNFINYSIWGFKELLIISLVLISFILINKLNFNQNSLKTTILFGTILGLISFINFSGSVIALMLLLIQFIFSKKKLFLRFLYSLIAFIAFIFFSAYEFSFFLGWLLSSYTIPGNYISFSNSPYLKMQEISGGGELGNYKIYSDSDILIKGKLQGFTQIEMYGLIFILFIFALIKYFRRIITNQHNLIIISFIILFYLIIIDLLGLNNSYYSSVTVVSSKYTVMCVPLIAIVISSQLDKLMTLLNKIKPLHLLIVLLSYLALYFLYISHNISSIYILIKNIIPIWNSDSYYISRLSFYFKFSMIITMITALSILFLYKVKGEKNLNTYWQLNNVSPTITLTIIFLLPFFLSVFSNYRLISFY